MSDPGLLKFELVTEEPAVLVANTVYFVKNATVNRIVISGNLPQDPLRVTSTTALENIASKMYIASGNTKEEARNSIDAAAIDHTHPEASETVPGFLSTALYTKLMGLSNYVHPTSDGNLHIPAIGTTNNGKVLKAGATAGSMSWGTLTKNDVGLSNVDNTADASKPVSTAQAAAISSVAADAAADATTKANAAQAAAISASTPSSHVGSTGTAHGVATTAVHGFMSSTDKAKLDGIAAGAQTNAVNSVAGKTGVVTLVKADVGLGNVDNTSDANKPVSTATQTALDNKAPVSHTHDASAIVSGTIADARLPERLRAVPQTVTDWNTAVGSGWYQGNSAANAPTTGYFIGNVECHHERWVTQVVHSFNTDSEEDTKTYRRESSDSSGGAVWGPWYRLRLSEAEQAAMTQAWWDSTTIPIDKVAGLHAALDAISNDSTARIAVSEKGAINGVATLGADGKVPTAQLPLLSSGGTELLTIDYESRGDLRTTVGNHAVVKGLGLFIFYPGSDEPDDDESCFATTTGRWLLEAVSWDVVDSWYLPETSYRETTNEELKQDILNLNTNIDSINSRLLTTKFLFASKGVTITSVAKNTQVTEEITVTGATTNDHVIITPPNALSFRISIYGRVTSPNTVTIYINNSTSTSQSISAGTWRVVVIKEN